jgi:hypothetical protein
VNDDGAPPEFLGRDTLEIICVFLGLGAYGNGNISEVTRVPLTTETRWASVILCLTHMKVVTGEFATLASQITSLVDVESVLSWGQLAKGGLNVETGFSITEGHYALYGACIKYCDCLGCHLIWMASKILAIIPYTCDSSIL